MGKNTGKVREFCQSGKVGTLNVKINLTLFLLALVKQECIPVGCVPPAVYRTGGVCPGDPPPRERNDRQV